MSRKVITDLLKKASVSYWLRKRFASVCELGVEKWGKRRVDVISVNMRGWVVISEIKSCPADYLTDVKWKEYIPRCNKMYLVFTQRTWEALQDKVLKDIEGTGVGVMVLDSTSGWLSVKSNAKDRLMTRKNKMLILARLAWRNGTSRRNSRRQRQFIPDGMEPSYAKVK